MSRRHESVFDDTEVSADLAEFHHKFVVPANKAPNNIVIVCKTHYIKYIYNINGGA